MSFLVATNVVASLPTDLNAARSCQKFQCQLELSSGQLSPSLLSLMYVYFISNQYEMNMILMELFTILSALYLLPS